MAGDPGVTGDRALSLVMVVNRKEVEDVIFLIQTTKIVDVINMGLLRNSHEDVATKFVHVGIN